MEFFIGVSPTTYHFLQKYSLGLSPFFFQRKSIVNLNRPEEPSPVTDKNWIVINLILLSINSYILRINSLKTNLTETAELVPSVFQRCYIGKREGRGDEVSANVTARKPQGTAWKK